MGNFSVTAIIAFKKVMACLLCGCRCRLLLDEEKLYHDDNDASTEAPVTPGDAAEATEAPGTPGDAAEAAALDDEVSAAEDYEPWWHGASPGQMCVWDRRGNALTPRSGRIIKRTYSNDL